MLALAVLVAIPVLTLVSAQGSNCTRTYVVQAGDICDGISAANNVSTYQLAAVNDNVINPECLNLVPGTSICLGLSGEDCTSIHVVQLDDTCDDIASGYGINSTIFYANNPQLNSDCTNLYVGEVVCTANTVMVPPPPASGATPGSVIPPTTVPANPDLPYCDEI